MTLKIKSGLWLLLLLILVGGESAFSQVNPKGDFKPSTMRRLGARVGYYGFNNFGELGIGYLVLNQPCNDGRGYPICTFPKKLEIDLTSEFKFNFDEPLIGAKLSVSYVVFCTPPINRMYLKTYHSAYGVSRIIYRTIGHTILGASLIHYTDFDKSDYVLRPEFGIMLPQNIYLANGKINLNMRIIFSSISYLDKVKSFDIPKQNLALLFLVK